MGLSHPAPHTRSAREEVVRVMEKVGAGIGTWEGSPADDDQGERPRRSGGV
jgi:hypothetical protein